MILKLLTVCITTNWKILKETGISDHLTSIRFSHPVMSGSLQSHRLQHTRLPCPAPTHGAYSNLSIELVMCIDLVMCIELVMPSNHLISVVHFSSCLQSFRVFSSESVLRIRWPKYWSFNFTNCPSSEYSVNPLGLTGFISFQSKGFSRILKTQESSPTPSYLCPENPVCRSRSKVNWAWNN